MKEPAMSERAVLKLRRQDAVHEIKKQFADDARTLKKLISKKRRGGKRETVLEGKCSRILEKSSYAFRTRSSEIGAMTHAQYKTRWCTCEHALSRTPTQVAKQPASLRIAPSFFSRWPGSLFLRVDARSALHFVEARGYRMGTGPNPAPRRRQFRGFESAGTRLVSISRSLFLCMQFNENYPLSRESRYAPCPPPFSLFFRFSRETSFLTRATSDATFAKDSNEIWYGH